MAYVKLKNISVVFPVLSREDKSLRAQLSIIGSAGKLQRQSRKQVTVQALSDISLHAKTGDRIGLVGGNGAGKTTLLRLIAGIYYPTTGSVEVEGTISTLFSGGMLVNEDLTGYESIEYGCIMLGLMPEQIKQAKKSVAEFSELGDYMNMPVRTYSAGMKVRLSFGMATCFKPDVLLLDEAIGAGDSHFMEKAKRRAQEFMGQSSILFLASHGADIISRICNKALLLDNGRPLAFGEVDQVLNMYFEDLQDSKKSIAAPTEQPTAISGGDSPDHPSQLAVDGKVETHWESSQTGEDVPGRAYVGVDFEIAPTEVMQFTLRQWAGPMEYNTIDKVLLQYSHDAFQEDVNTVAKVKLVQDIARNSYEVPVSEAARYWRLLADSPTKGGPWGVLELAFNDTRVLGGSGKKPVGRAISRDYAAPHIPRRAFDKRQDTMWVSGVKDPEVEHSSWLGFDFGINNKVEVRRLAIRQWDDGFYPNTVSSVKLQCSDDKFNSEVVDIAVLPLEKNDELQKLDAPPSQEARYWRILANSPTGGGHWGVSELELCQTPAPDDPPLKSQVLRKFAEAVPITSDQVPGYDRDFAFDGHDDTHWMSERTDPDIAVKAWLGFDFGQGEAVRVDRIVLQQWQNPMQRSQVDSVLLQYSHLGFQHEAHTAAELDLELGCLSHQYLVKGAPKARYWRILANGPTKGGYWGVVNLELWDSWCPLAGGGVLRLAQWQKQTKEKPRQQ